MKLYSASSFGFIGFDPYPRGSGTTSVPVGTSGSYGTAGLTNVLLPTIGGSSKGGNPIWAPPTGSYLLESIWYYNAKGTPVRSSENTPVTGNGTYTATLAWTFDYSFSSEVGTVIHGGGLSGRSSHYTRSAYSVDLTSRYRMTINNTGITTAYIDCLNAAYNVKVSAGYCLYNEIDQKTATIVSAVTTTKIPSGTYTIPDYGSSLSAHKAHFGDVGTAVAQSSNGIHLYGDN